MKVLLDITRRNFLPWTIITFMPWPSDERTQVPQNIFKTDLLAHRGFP